MGCGHSDESQSIKSLQFDEVPRRLSSLSLREGSIVQIAPCVATKYQLDVTNVGASSVVALSLGAAVVDSLSQRWELEMKLEKSIVQCRIVSLSCSKVLCANIESRSVALADAVDSPGEWFELEAVDGRKGNNLQCRILCPGHDSGAKYCLTLDGGAAEPVLLCGLASLEHVKPEQCFEVSALSFGKWDKVPFERYLSEPLMRWEPRCQSQLLEVGDSIRVVDAVTSAILERRKETRNDGLVFTDSSFPHSEGSIVGQRYCQPADAKLPPHRSLKWRRLADLTPQGKRPLLFADGSSCEDICQGWLGNSMFCAVVDALATRQDIVQNAFYPSSYNDAGIYAVRVIINKKPYCVLVDDFLPSDGGRVAFGRSSDSTEWWFALYEKAFAKVFGYYDFLSAASERWVESCNNLPSVWEIVCGTSHASLSTAHADCFEHVRNCLTARGFAIAYSSSGGLQQRAKTAGIVSGHTYTILRVEKFNDTLLIQIRNTWGGFEWNGKWSDSDKVTWEGNPSIRARCGMEAEKVRDDGIFWMDWADFVKYFDEVSCVQLPQDTMPFETVTDISCNGRSCFLSHSAFLPHVNVVRDDADNDMQISLVYVNSRVSTNVKTCVNIFLLPCNSSKYVALCDPQSANASRGVVAAAGWHLGHASMRGPTDAAHRNFVIVPAAAVDSRSDEKFRIHIRSSKKFSVTVDDAPQVVTKTVIRWHGANTMQSAVGPSTAEALKCCMQLSLHVRAAVNASVALHIGGASGPPAPGECFEISSEASPDLRVSSLDDKAVLLEGVGASSQLWHFEPDAQNIGLILISHSEGQPYFVCHTSSAHEACLLRKIRSSDSQDESLHLDSRNDDPSTFGLSRADRQSKVVFDYYGRQSTPLVSCPPTADSGQLGRFSFVRGNHDGSACLFAAVLLNDNGESIATARGYSPLVLAVHSVPAGHYRLCLSSAIAQDYLVVRNVVTGGELTFDSTHETQ